jgi:hypothetical protein
MTLKMRKGGSRHRNRPAIRTITQTNSNASGQVLPMARALLFRACGRRTLDVVVVTRCPHCGRGGHLHRGTNLDGAVRQSGCSPRREYLLAVVA